MRWSQVRALVGSGDRIALFAMPVALAALAARVRDPRAFAVRPTRTVARLSAVALACGVLGWAWSVMLILWKVPRGELITRGPFAVVKHPLYTSVGLLVLPAAGLLRRSWLGALVGIATYLGSRLFAPAEEHELASRFGADWEAYERRVLLPGL
jgi:protein-S-isoprenylcysteine O-methyltransferase Ste14